MTALGALTLYPLWAISVLVGVTALRLGRIAGIGLISLCFTLTLFVTGLVLFMLPETRSLGEHVIPIGMLLAGAFVQSGVDVTAGGGAARRPLLVVAWGGSGLVAALGAAQPHLLYGAGMDTIGPLFWPIAVVSAIASAATLTWLVVAARRTTGRLRRQLVLLAAGSLLGSLGGGGAIIVHVLGWLPLEIAALPLLGALPLVAGAVLAGQVGRARRLVLQGLVYAVVTAVLTGFGLVIYFDLLPYLAPGGASAGFVWLVVVTFFAALPLDAIRSVLVEGVGRRLFPDPIGVRDLADAAQRSEARADHAERLAEIGVMASAVAHEIRNPLGIIAVQAKLMEKSDVDAAHVQVLRAQVERGRRFVDDLLRYGKPRPLDIGVVRIADALAAAVASVQRVALAPSPAITVTGDLDVELDADPSAFHDVHVILIHNAVAAVHGCDGRITLSASQRASTLEVAVEDDGPGVQAAFVSRLFEPFASGRGRDSAYPGTGLGLAIAARTVARHGGTIRHERPERGGARFVVTWPLRAESAAPRR